MSHEVGYGSMIAGIDAAIDGTPYNGHFSTYEFISTGTPVWSFREPRLQQQYGQMLLGHAGLARYVFKSAEAMIDDVVANIRVKTPEDAEQIRRQVTESRLGDPIRATRLFEDAIERAIVGHGM